MRIYPKLGESLLLTFEGVKVVAVRYLWLSFLSGFVPWNFPCDSGLSG